ncbi:MAG: ATP-binding protein, partial [Fervidobacterium sp.]
GDYNIGEKGIDYWKKFNRDFAKSGYVYRYIPIVVDNKLEAIYVLKAPFSFTINNKNSHPLFVLLYIPVIISPLIFFILYLLIFTRQFYLDVSRNLNILLEASKQVSDKNFDFTVQGLSGKEFIKIQVAFNEMIKTIHSILKNLWDLNSEKSKILSSIAHDIRTPVTVIKGQMEIIEDLKDYKVLKDIVRIVNSNCNRIIALANNLSLLGKIENTDFLVVKNRVNLYELLRSKEEELRIMAFSKNVEIRFEINLKKKYYILDENLVLRLLDNVLYNSLRFTSEGEINLVVHDDNDKIHFLCLDTGKGFNLEDLDNLFKAYYQGENYKDHFGLGLYIAKRIVDKFGGEIKAYNRKNGGAAVEFFLKEIVG